MIRKIHRDRKEPGVMKKIETSKAPAAIGPYSQAMIVNGLLYTSGQIPIHPETGMMEGTGLNSRQNR